MTRAPLWITLLLWSACSTSATDKVPTDLKDRFPAPASLAISIPGSAGPAGSGSEAVFGEVAAADRALSARDLLGEFLQAGGVENRDISITVALEGAPRVADQVVRYSRDRSRLDVERIGDHALCYLQYDRGSGFDPDRAISESRMVIEGSTVVPASEGLRSDVGRAAGLADPSAGYLRFHFNHRLEDLDSLHNAVQLDYRFKSDAVSLHLTYFIRPDATDKPATAGFWLIRKSDGSGLIYASQRQGSSLTYRFVAQFRSDGSLAVWSGDGKLWGCYDAGGAELGNSKSPAACSGFTQKFSAPPKGPGVWPDLPAGLP
jgi:hypothetical protein